MYYKIFKCKKCGSYNVSSSKSVLKCKFCGNKIDAKKSKVYFKSENPRLVSNALLRIKEEEFKLKSKKNGIEIFDNGDFFNFELEN